MKETRMPPALAANLVENSGNTIYRVIVINIIPTLVQIMGWRWSGNIIWANDELVYWCM